MDIGSAKVLAAALAVAPLAGVAIGLGNLFSASVTSVGRNPGSRDSVFPLTILGFALTEAIGLFALLMAFLIMFS